jgi:hypothetical protein
MSGSSITLGASPDYYKQVATRVLKAVDGHPVPPKEKHVRALIIESHNPSTAQDAVLVFYAELAKRLATGDPAVCLKALIVMHRVMQEGSPLFLARRTLRSDYLERLATAWGTQEWTRGHGKIAIAYNKFLVAKIRLHTEHQGLTGDMSAERFAQVQPLAAMSATKVETLAAGLLNLQALQLLVVDLVISYAKLHQLDDLKVAPFIPIVIESYAIYTLVTKLLRHLTNESVQDDCESPSVARLQQKFYMQYRELAQFYWEATQIKYVATSTTVPTLPDEPPVFDRPKKSKQVEPPKPVQPQPAPATIQQPLIDIFSTATPTPAPQPPAPVQPVNPFIFAPTQVVVAPVV